MTDTLNIETLSFEQALSRLETLVRKMETGDAALEDSIMLYEQGMQLKSHCEKKLAEAKMRVDKIVAAENNNVSVQPFENRE